MSAERLLREIASDGLFIIVTPWGQPVLMDDAEGVADKDGWDVIDLKALAAELEMAYRVAAEKLITAEAERDRYKTALARIAGSIDPRTEAAAGVARAALHNTQGGGS